MGKDIIFTLNTAEVMKDFRTYDKDTKLGFKKVLKEYANKIKKTQKSILRYNVIKWTGNLASSIIAKYVKGYTWEIGPFGPSTYPDRRVRKYRQYIEIGDGKFSGYHYVENSLKQHKKNFLRDIQKVIEKSQKK